MEDVQSYVCKSWHCFFNSMRKSGNVNENIAAHKIKKRNMYTQVQQFCVNVANNYGCTFYRYFSKLGTTLYCVS